MYKNIFVYQKNEKILVGYIFFFLVLKPTVSFSGRIIYHYAVQKIKVVRYFRVRVKRLVRKSKESENLKTFLEAFLNYLKFLSLVSFLFSPVRQFYLKLGLVFSKILNLIFCQFGFFCFNIMLSICPVFLTIFYKIVSNRFLKKFFQKLKSFYYELCEKDEAILVVLYIIQIVVGSVQIFANLMRFCIIIFSANAVGQEFNIILSNLKEAVKLTYTSKNFFSFILRLFILLKKQFFAKIEYERKQWQLAPNYFARGARIASWLVSIIIFVRLTGHFKAGVVNSTSVSKSSFTI